MFGPSKSSWHSGRQEVSGLRNRTTVAVVALAVTASIAPAASALEGRPGSGMLVIGHRGAPMYAAESTIGSYQRAADLGADLLEGDLVMSKDGRLVLCHDIELSRVTDIASRPEFAGRQSVRNFNGVDYTGFWVDDFTLAELQTLRKWDGQTLTTLDDSDRRCPGPRREPVHGTQGVGLLPEPRAGSPAGTCEHPSGARGGSARLAGVGAVEQPRRPAVLRVGRSAIARSSSPAASGLRTSARSPASGSSPM